MGGKFYLFFSCGAIYIYIYIYMFLCIYMGG